ncbi:sigma-70 family RNA polymerase sigma factor [Thalassotalea ganghwensis]
MLEIENSRYGNNPRNVSPKYMLDNEQHQQLSAWLCEVASERSKVAFTHLFKFFAPKIQRISQSKLNNEALASEVVQETMSNVWRKAHLFNADKGAATTWVYTVMRNVTFDLLRKIKSKKEDNLSDDIWPVFEAELTQDELFGDHLASEQMSKALNKLPEQQQEVVRGFYFLELSQEQLATNLNIPLGTVKSRLRLALAKLKQEIGADHD